MYWFEPDPKALGMVRHLSTSPPRSTRRAQRRARWRAGALAPCVELGPSSSPEPEPAASAQRTTRLVGPFAGAVPGAGNGGIVAGTLARYLSAPWGAGVEVRLERPVPLATELTVTLDDEGARLELAGTTLARAAVVQVPPTAPPRVTADEATQTTPVVPLATHPAPGCFVCGPANAAGLNLQPGRLPGRPIVAAVWSPPARLGTAAGVLPPPVVWASLDCPSWYGAAGGRPALLGTVRVHQFAPVPVEEPIVVTGWRTGASDRKTHAGSALCTTAGVPLAVAASTWIHPKEHRP
jgi:hypothetical protein